MNAVLAEKFGVEHEALIDLFDNSISPNVRDAILSHPSAAMAILTDYDPRFGDPLQEGVVRGVVGDWRDREYRLRGSKDEVTDILNELAKRTPERKHSILDGALRSLPKDLTQKVSECSDDDTALYLLGRHDYRLYPSQEPKFRSMQKELLDLLRKRHTAKKSPGGKVSKRGRRLRTFFSKNPTLANQIDKTKGEEGADLCRDVFKKVGMKVSGGGKDKSNIQICHRAAHAVAKSRN